MQFNLKWKAEFNRIDEVCIKPLPFDYRKTKYNSDSILRYVEIANAHHHKWGYPKMKKCAATLMVSMWLFAAPSFIASLLSALPSVLYTVWLLFIPLFIEEQRAILLPALLQNTALFLFPYIVGCCVEYVTERLNITDITVGIFNDIDDNCRLKLHDKLALGGFGISFAFGVWFAGRAFFATMGLLTPLLQRPLLNM